MKLSEAIRKGSEGTYQIQGHYFDFGFEEIGCCALGAAWLACFPDYRVSELGVELTRLSDCTGANLWKVVEDDDQHHRRLWEAITRRNDALNYSREAIADWLEGQGL